MSWERKRLKYLVSCNDDVLSEKTDEDYEISYVEISDVVFGQGIQNQQTFLFKDAPSRARRLVKNGDLIVSTVRTYLKAIALVQNPLKNLVVSTGFAVVRPRSLSPMFSKFLFSSEHLIDEIIKRSKGVSYPSITTEELLEIEVAVPSEHEQERIGIFLEKKTASISEIILKKRHLIDLLNEERASLINHAVTKGIDDTVSMKPSGIKWLGNIPAHWKVKRLKRVTSMITNGYVGPTRDILKPEGVRYIQSLHVKEGTIKFHTPYFVPEEWSISHGRSILKENDILVVQTGAGTGNIGIVPKEFEGCNCHALIILRISSDLSHAPFLLNVLQSNYGFHLLKSIETGALHPHLNSTIICDVELPIPPVDEQNQIVNFINVNCKRINGAISKIEKEIELLTEYKTSLIYEVVTGKVKVVDTEVEEPMMTA